MPESIPTLEQLMLAANRGDAAAYHRLLGSLAVVLRVQVRRGLARIGRSHEDAEDIVQESLLAIHLKRHTWSEQEPLAPWVRAIAHHKLIDQLRRKGFREHLDIDDFANSLGAVETNAEGAGHDCAVLLAGLPARHRAIVEGVSIEGHSARDVATRLGMSEGAVRVTLHRALKAMATACRRGEA